MDKISISSRLPGIGESIFSTMTALSNRHDAINLSQGFPNFDCAEELKSLVCKAMRAGHNQYAPMPGLLALREEISNKMELLYGVQVDPIEEVTITAGATQGLFTAIAAFVHPGDEVIIFEPAYDSYKPAIQLQGAKAISYTCSAPDFAVDWEKVRALISDKTRMIIINTPHNPTGRTFKDDDLIALEQLLSGTSILLLSDEVYEHLVFDGVQHKSVWEIPELRQRSLVVYSFGKTFHNTGWKIGYTIGAAYLMREFRKVHQYNVFSVNTPAQYGLAEYLKNSHVYLSLSTFYEEKRNLFREYLSASRFEVFPCEGTYFQTVGYMDISEEDDVIFAQRLVKDIGVAGIPISVFYSDGRNDRVLRFCFAKTDEVLKRAGEKLSKL